MKTLKMEAQIRLWSDKLVKIAKTTNRPWLQSNSCHFFLPETQQNLTIWAVPCQVMVLAIFKVWDFFPSPQTYSSQPRPYRTTERERERDVNNS